MVLDIQEPNRVLQLNDNAIQMHCRNYLKTHLNALKFQVNIIPDVLENFGNGQPNLRERVMAVVEALQNQPESHSPLRRSPF